MSLLSIEHVNKSYSLGGEKTQVLHDINASFNSGEFVSILGESGGGKSTLLNIIAGLDQEYTGRVTYRGQDLKSGGKKALDKYRRETIGFIFQSFNLISHLTIIENVMVPLRMMQLSKPAQRERAMKLLNQLGVGAQAEKHPNQLSGGQKQRVAIARALASDPDILIADEPTGALDEANTEAVLAILKSIADSGKLVIQVTHSIPAAHTGSRIVHLDNGTVTQIEELTPASASKAAVKIAPQRPKLGFWNAFNLAVKHLRYNWKRNIFIIAGFAIGIFAVVTMLFMGTGIKGYMTQQINTLVNPRSFVMMKKTNSIIPDVTKNMLTNQDLQRVRAVKHVKSAQPIYIAAQAQLSNHNKMASETYFTTNNPALLSKDLKAGRNPHSGQSEVTLSQTSAKQLTAHWRDMVGKTITLHVQVLKNGKPLPVVHNLKVVGITKSTASYTDYATMKKVFAANNYKIQPSGMAVSVPTLAQVKGVQNKLTSMKNAAGKKRYTITGAASVLDNVLKYVTLATYALAAIAGISLLVSAFMIIVVMFISVTERTKEIGVLRALGATTGDVRNLFLSEALVISGMAGLLGLGLALGAALGVNGAIASTIHYAILQPSWMYSVGIVIVSVAIGIVAALAPARQAAKLDPIKALATE